MKFTIVTPCRNAEAHLRETMESVLNQQALVAGRAELEYIVCDGASTDGTLDIARSFHDDRIRISSVPDSGMYEALARGLQMATGDVVAYLNASDLYYPTTFDVVTDIMSAHDVTWLTGHSVGVTEQSVQFSCRLPFRYRRRLFESGAYGNILPFVQQEGTFWRRSLMDSVDFDRLARWRLAGDYFLWLSFARSAQLSIAASSLGAFKFHAGRLSEDLAAYRHEMRAMTRRMTATDRIVAAFDQALWFAPRPIKKYFNRRHLFLFDQAREQWS